MVYTVGTVMTPVVFSSRKLDIQHGTSLNRDLDQMCTLYGNCTGGVPALPLNKYKLDVSHRPLLHFIQFN